MICCENSPSWRRRLRRGYEVDERRHPLEEGGAKKGFLAAGEIVRHVGQALLLIRGTVKITLFSSSWWEIGDCSLHVRSLQYGSNSARRREKRRYSWVVVPSPLLFLGAVKGAASVGGQGLLLFSVLGLLLLLSQLHIPLCL